MNDDIPKSSRWVSVGSKDKRLLFVKSVDRGRVEVVSADSGRVSKIGLARFRKLFRRKDKP